MRRRGGSALSRPDRAAAYRVASVALGYPDEAASAGLELARLAAAELPAGRVRERLVAATEELVTTGARARSERYVAVFDLRRRTTLHLTWYTHGDTRERGMALAELKAGYRAAGFELADGELPDHLAVALEFASRAPEEGEDLLRRHRAGLELLRRELADGAAPYRDVLEAVCDLLGGVGLVDARLLARLAADGPPTEQVGLEPYAPPEYLGVR